jgi:hypothetical protein
MWICMYAGMTIYTLYTYIYINARTHIYIRVQEFCGRSTKKTQGTGKGEGSVVNAGPQREIRATADIMYQRKDCLSNDRQCLYTNSRDAVHATICTPHLIEARTRAGGPSNINYANKRIAILAPICVNRNGGATRVDALTHTREPCGPQRR